MRRIAITRPSTQLTSLMALGTARGIEVIPLPLISILNLPFSWPDTCSIDKVDWVFFSSANAVTAFLERLAELGLHLTNRTRYAAVGAKTALLLKENGLHVSFTPSEAYGKLMFEEFADSLLRNGQVLVYARGKEVRYDPQATFSGRQIKCIPIVCYETRPQPVSQQTVMRLSSEDYILFTAPSTVDAYVGQFGQPVARPIAIGRTTAAQMDQYGWSAFITMKQADINTILEYI